MWVSSLIPSTENVKEDSQKWLEYNNKDEILIIVS